MNAQSKIDHETVVNMTSKGQVLIPKALRELSGLTPGGPVRVGTNDRGETVILPAIGGASETSAERRTRIRAALAELCGKYPIGMSTDEYMQEIRGDWQP